MTILLIALLHAIPILIIGYWKRTKSAIIIASILSGVIGVLTGNPAYIAQDLFGVGIGYYLAISFF